MILLKGVNTKTKIYDFGEWNLGLRHMSAILCRRPCPDKASAGRQALLHSRTPQHPHLSHGHGHRLEEGALGYSNMKTPRLQDCLLRFSPVFHRGTHLKIGRESSSSSSQLHLQ